MQGAQVRVIDIADRSVEWRQLLLVDESWIELRSLRGGVDLRFSRENGASLVCPTKYIHEDDLAEISAIWMSAVFT